MPDGQDARPRGESARPADDRDGPRSGPRFGGGEPRSWSQDARAENSGRGAGGGDHGYGEGGDTGYGQMARGTETSASGDDMGMSGGYGGQGGYGSQGGKAGFGPLNQGSTYDGGGGQFGPGGTDYHSGSGGYGPGGYAQGFGGPDRGRGGREDADRYGRDPGGPRAPGVGPASQTNMDRPGAYPRFEDRGHDHDHEPGYRHWRAQQLSSHDQDYQRWRDEQTRRYDEEYTRWRTSRHESFSREFQDWRSQRGDVASASAASGAASGTGSTAHAASSADPAGTRHESGAFDTVVSPVAGVADGGTRAHGDHDRKSDDKHDPKS